MPEQDLNPTSAKFISSLVKSLQILCNGHVEFHESIELVGHINVRVDHKYKFDYIVDEQVSKEGEDSATTFLSNSYHSCPPLRQPRKRSSSVELDQDVMFSDLSHSINGKSSQSKAVQDSLSSSHDFCSEDTLAREEVSNPNFSVTVGSPNRRGSQADQIVIKLEGDDDSNDCMVLPASPGDYDPVGEVSVEGFQAVDASVSFEESDGNQVSCMRKRRQPNEPGAVHGSSSKGRVEGGEKSTAGKRGASELIGRFAAYECLYCSVILTEREDLGLHSKSCPSPSCSMICLTCGEKFPSNPDMRQHLKFVHNQKTFGCKFCDMMFLSSSGLLSHTKAKHKPDAKTLCQICGQAFHNKANLEGHMNMHLGLRPFSCKKCGKSYGHSKSLMTHEKTCSKSVSSPRGAKSLSSKQLSQITPEILSPRKASSSANLNLTEDKRASRTARNLGASDISSFHEQNQPFCDSKGLCNAKSSLKNEANADFPYNSYQSLQTGDLTGMSDSSNVDNKPRDAVYSQTSADFAMTQVNYGMFSSGILPAHR